MDTAGHSLSTVVTKRLNEGGDLFARPFEEDGLNDAVAMELVRWFGQFQREVEKVSPRSTRSRPALVKG